MLTALLDPFDEIKVDHFIKLFKSLDGIDDSFFEEGQPGFLVVSDRLIKLLELLLDAIPINVVVFDGCPVVLLT